MEEKNTKSDAALREEKVLQFWRENKIFEKSLEQTAKGKEFVFYDGPVTANSKPVLHTMVPFSFKDIIPRYKTMRGFHVRRKGGWDTHGLPVELQIEKKLGLNSKKAIEEYGIAKFNNECKASVWEYVELWKAFTSRMGYWADQDNPYVTYHNDFIESVWNIVKKVDEQKLLYKDYKVVPWCPRCGTTLSSHELAQGYEDVKDLSITTKFKVKGKENTYILAWTTTPWTLPGNIALAVGADITYVEVKVETENGTEILVLAKDRLSVVTIPYEVVKEYTGREMTEMQYEPLFPYLKEQIEKKGESTDKAFRVYLADFVNTKDGTGIVHTAVMYGQDDFELGNKVGLPKHHLVDLEGKFVKGTGIFEGRFVKEEVDGKPTLAIDIIKSLQEKNFFFSKENYQHSYPHCWRCKTALIYYARDSWYIRMSDPEIKQKLIKENKSIKWEPAYIRDGRFGEWLREIKDWAISRERYWGTPLPVWVCSKCGKREVVGSLEVLKNKTKNSGNKYFVMRHGGTEGNKNNIVSFKNQNKDHLTEEGKKEVENTAYNLKKENIDLIVTSNFTRTKQTAEKLRDVLGLPAGAVVEDSRLQEINPGEFDGGSWSSYHGHMSSRGKGWFGHKIGGGESLMDVKKRTAAALYDIEEKYKGKNIVLVTHGGPAWLLFVNAGLYEPDNKEYHPENSYVFIKEFKKFGNAEVRELPFIPLPHDDQYNLDLHRPYIDGVKLVCSNSTDTGEVCGGEMARTKEVMDVWFDSGAMPFAQDHYPFENTDWVEGKGYPADFISEAIDQTRGWFYTLHAIGILMGRGKAFKNVICLGHLMDANGKKMSKSLGNIVDPWVVIDKYGVDTLRMWMYSVNQPGESKNFDEKTVTLLHQQVFTLLYNVLAFYELYREQSLEKSLGEGVPVSKNVLDRWIVARLDQLNKLTRDNLDNYKLLEPTRAIRDFIGDLSTWYLRRSRERIKAGDVEAKRTLYFVLKTLAKIMAPFAPFTAEDIWMRLKTESDVASVHLAKWPKEPKVSWFSKFFGYRVDMLNMEEARRVVSLGLQYRQKAGIPVRQALHGIKVSVKINPEYVDLLKDELNIKEVVFDKMIQGDLELDTNITEVLKEEGEYRELVRALQDMRKKMGLTAHEVVMLSIDVDERGKNLVQKFEGDLKKTVLVSKIEYKANDGTEVKAGDLAYMVKIEK